MVTMSMIKAKFHYLTIWMFQTTEALHLPIKLQALWNCHRWIGSADSLVLKQTSFDDKVQQSYLEESSNTTIAKWFDKWKQRIRFSKDVLLVQEEETECIRWIRMWAGIMGIKGYPVRRGKASKFKAIEAYLYVSHKRIFRSLIWFYML